MNIRNSRGWGASLPPDGRDRRAVHERGPSFPADWIPDAAVDAPGKPGISPTWTGITKDAVGCS